MDVEDLSARERRLVEAITARFDERVELIRQEFMAEITRRTQSLEAEITKLKSKVCALEESSDDADAYEKRDFLLFSGRCIPNAVAGENCTDLVRNVLRDKFKLHIPTSDISSSFRLGRKPVTQAPDTRQIAVRFCRGDTKREILSANKLHRRRSDDGSNFFVNEYLTSSRKTNLYILRTLKRKFPKVVTGCAAIDCKVYAWIDGGGRGNSQTMLMNSRKRLEDFCMKTLENSLSDLVDGLRD